MSYHVRRLGQAVVTMVSGLFIAFALYRLMPGGPMQAIMADIAERMRRRQGGVDSEQLAREAEALTGINPDQPIPVAFYEYVRDIVLYQDFGESLVVQSGTPVFDILFQAMPWSMFLSVFGIMLGFTASILVGVVMAWYEGTKVDSGLTVFVLAMGAIPYYVGAIVMLTVLAFQWGLFPTGGKAPPNVEPGFHLEYMLGIVHHGALPILSTFIVGFAAGSLNMRANTVRIIGSDYIRSARLRGLSRNRILSRYLTRNSIMPLYTRFMIGIGGIFGSNVITERIFQYVGMGWFLLEAVQKQDYPLLMASFIFFGAFTIAGVLVADFTYGLIDPRAETGATRESY